MENKTIWDEFMNMTKEETSIFMEDYFDSKKQTIDSEYDIDDEIWEIGS